MSLIHRITDATVELYEALDCAENDEERARYQAGIEHNAQQLDEVLDAYSRLIHAQFCTSSGWGAFREVTGAEVLINVAFGDPVEFRLYGDMVMPL